MLKFKKYNNYYFYHNNNMKKNTNILKFNLCLTIFFIISILSIYSAKTISLDGLGNIFVKQVIYYILGLGILLISYYYKKEIIKYAFLWYWGFNFLLFILLFLGVSINGSRCWLILGPFSFQPSEFMKISLILVLANILNKYNSKKDIKTEFKMLTKIIIIFLIPAILTFLEPDTGVVIIYFIIMISMILYRGINKKWYYFIIITLTILGCIISYMYFFKTELLLNILGKNIFYRIERILNWSNGSGYQLENSLITIGSSGILGFGFNNIPLYYPEASTDFVFTSFSSSFGFIGNIFLLITIIIFDSSILSLCTNKVKRIDKYLLIGIFSMITYQQIQNICMTIGLLPITGITLPYISYGGSSLFSYMFILGILLRIAKDEKIFLN